MKEYIERPLYIDRIKPYIGKNLIKVLTGQRLSLIHISEPTRPY